jgi:ATP-dependent Clp protease ATP-binding subunit ClpA
MPINQTANISNALVEAYGIASEKRNEFITPEHLLAGFLKDSDFWEVLSRCGRAEELEKNLYEYINSLDRIPEGTDLSIEFSAQLQELFEKAGETAAAAMSQTVQTHHLIFSIFHLEESYARFHLESCLECSIPDFLNSLLEFSEAEAPEGMQSWRKYFKDLEGIERMAVVTRN